MDHARDDRSSESADLPMAPSEAEWASMTPADRLQVIDSLPADLGLLPSEGTPHSNAVRHVRNTLDDHFARSGRPVFIADDLAVYYPGERAFVPDILAVVDVGMHDRMKWVVSEERRGLDLVLEVLVSGNRRKDLEINVSRYARLGIREYFVFDYSRVRLLGYRLDRGARYEPLAPQAGCLRSEVLGLEMQLQGTRLRFFAGNVLIPEAVERIATLERMLAAAEDRIRGEAEQNERDARRLAEEEARRKEEEARREEEKARREEAEAKLAAALAELERLRGAKS